MNKETIVEAGGGDDARRQVNDAARAAVRTGAAIRRPKLAAW